MKKSLLIILAVLAVFGEVNAQDHKTFEHNIQVGAGFSWTDDDTERIGATVSIGYGLDIRLNEKLSVMPMVEYRETSENLIRSGFDGVDFNDFRFLDFSVSGRWHFNSGKTPVTVGVGPYVSYAFDRDKYYIDYEPHHILNGKPKIKTVDAGVMPTVTFDVWKQVSLGAKMNIGLLNSSEKYQAIDDQECRYMKSAEVFVRVKIFNFRKL